MSSVTPSGPHVRRSASATWRIKHRWGPNFGDVTDYTVSKNAGSSRVRITGLSGRGDENWPADLARELNAAINAALEWDGEDPPEDSSFDDGAGEMNNLDTSKVTRVEVINETGRAFVQGPDPRMESLVEAVLQDEGRTLKVRIKLPLDRSRTVGQIDEAEGPPGILDPYTETSNVVQTRDDVGHISTWSTIADAFGYADESRHVWKISFHDTDGRRIRLLRAGDNTDLGVDDPVRWVHRSMEDEVTAALESPPADSDDQDQGEDSPEAQQFAETAERFERRANQFGVSITESEIPPGTVRRAPADRGYLHAILLDQRGSPARWLIVNLFGAKGSVLTDEDVADWPVVYVPEPDDIWAAQTSGGDEDES